MTTTRDFVTVDMRGLKAALEARAVASKTSVSELVRLAVAEMYELCASESLAPVNATGNCAHPKVIKVSLRLAPEELALLDARVGRVTPSRSAVVSGLLGEVAAVQQGGNTDRAVSELIASRSELATMTRYVSQLSALLRQGQGVAAREYRDRLEGLAAEVRLHLKLSAGVIDGLRPRRTPLLPAKELRP